MSYILSGWFETEDGVELFTQYGETLQDCVECMQSQYPDFGHTDMEIEGGMDAFSLECMTLQVYDIVRG